MQPWLTIVIYNMPRRTSSWTGIRPSAWGSGWGGCRAGRGAGRRSRGGRSAARLLPPSPPWPACRGTGPAEPWRHTATAFRHSQGRYRHSRAVALTVGSVPRRIFPKLRHFRWLLKMNNQLTLRNLRTILHGTDPTVSATAPWIPVVSFVRQTSCPGYQ